MDGVMADGLNSCFEEGEVREPAWKMNQNSEIARS